MERETDNSKKRKFTSSSNENSSDIKDSSYKAKRLRLSV